LNRYGRLSTLKRRESQGGRVLTNRWKRNHLPLGLGSED